MMIHTEEHIPGESCNFTTRVSTRIGQLTEKKNMYISACLIISISVLMIYSRNPIQTSDVFSASNFNINGNRQVLSSDASGNNAMINTRIKTKPVNPTTSGPKMKQDHENKANTYIDLQAKGRFGNQMLQYAAFYALVLKNKSRTPFILQRTVTRLIRVFPNLTIKGDNVTLQNSHTAPPDERQITSWYSQLPAGNVTIHGYFSSHIYFDFVEEEIRKEYTFPAKTRKTVLNYFREIAPTRWRNTTFVRVGVHVRRTDRANPRRVANFGEVVHPPRYFHHAMDYFINLYKRVQFVVASDDLLWCRQHLAKENVVFSEHDYTLDFPILAMCDHMIISSGSFGWWAGWLCRGTTIYYGVLPRNGTYERRKYGNKRWVPVPRSRFNNWIEII